MVAKYPRRLLLILTGLALPLFVPAALAQVTTAVISGVVKDQTGGALPGVVVTVTNLGTGIVRAAVTDGEGRYRASDLSLGTYELRAELTGFQTGVRQGIELTVGREAVVDFSLSVGDISEEVVVLGDAPLVDTRSGTLSSLVTESQIKELPLNGRDVMQLLTLSAGVTQVRAGVSGVTGGYGKRISVGGSRPDMMGWLTDGTDTQNTFRTGPSGAAGVQLGVESIQEFRILTNAYSPEYGSSGGGIVNTVTKSGSKDVHGTAFEFFRDSAMDAPNYFDPPIGAPPFRRHQFGFSLGGPIVKGKTFFFGSYEGLRQNLATTGTVVVPTEAARAGILPGRPPIAVDLTAQALLTLLPEPNGQDFGDGRANYVGTQNTSTTSNFFTVRLDHTFNQNRSLYGRFTYDHAQRDAVDTIQLFVDANKSRRHSGTIEYTELLGPHALNRIRFGFNRAFDGNSNTAIRDIGPLIDMSSAEYPGNITVSGISGFGGTFSSPTNVQPTSFEIAENFSYTSGAHTIKAGMQYSRLLFWENTLSFASGQWRFNSLQDFLAGRVSSLQANLPNQDGVRNFRQNNFGFYVQDQWTVTPRLSLDLGLRYEFITVPREIDGKEANLRYPLDPAPTIGPMFRNPSLRNFAPRVSGAWMLTSDGRTALRAGIGTFFDELNPGSWHLPSVSQPPFVVRGQLNSVPLAGSYAQLAALPPESIKLALFSFDYEADTPYLLQYNVNVQRQLSTTISAQLGYVGSRGYHQPMTREADSAVAVIQPDGQYFFPPNAPLRNPNFLANRQTQTIGRSWYNGLLASLTKRLSHGFQMEGSYTWSKSIDQGSQTFTILLGRQGNMINPDDPTRNNGLSLFDVRQTFVFSTTWMLPWAQEASGVKGALAGGWQVGGIVMLQSGLAFTPTLGFNNSRNRATNSRFEVPSLEAGASNNPVLGGPDRYFDPTVFVLAPPGYFGNLGRNTVIGPGVANVDLTLTKNTRVHVKAKPATVQFRLEIFNLLNRANFGTPSGSAVLNTNGTPNFASAQIRSTATTSRQIQLGLKFIW